MRRSAATVSRKTLNRIAGGVSLLLLSAAIVPVIATSGTGFRSGVVFYLLVALFVLAAITWAGTTDFLFRHLPFTWRGFSRSGVEVALAHGNGWFQVKVIKHGKSLPNAAILIETGFPLFERVPEKGDPIRTGSIWQEGRRAGWSESGILISGGGHETRLSFRGHPPFGKSEIYVRIYDDALGQPFETTKTLIVEPDSQQKEFANSQLENAISGLEKNRQMILSSLTYGIWSGKLKTGWLQSPALDLNSEIKDQVSLAFEEAKRAQDAFDSRESILVTNEDRLERVLVETDCALIRLESRSAT